MGVRVLTNTIVYGVHTFTVRELQHTRNNILVLVEDDAIRPVCLRYGCFLPGARRADDYCPKVLENLCKPQAKTACDSVDKDDVVLLDVIRLRGERDRGHALGGGGSALVGGDIVRKDDGIEPVWRNVFRECTARGGCLD